MTHPALTKYSYVYLVLFLLSCSQQVSQKDVANPYVKRDGIIYKKQVIVKNSDSIFLYRITRSVQDSFLDTIYLKQDIHKSYLVFPSIGDYSIELKHSIPHKKIYNFSENKFMVQANYKSLIIQYIFNESINKLEAIFIIEDTDEIFPDFNQRKNDTIAIIQYIRAGKENVNIFTFIDSFSKSFIVENIKADSIYYILRKEGIVDYIY